MEWTFGPTEQEPARCSTTRASPNLSASSRPPVVTMITTALSPTPLILGLSWPVQPDRRGHECDACEQDAADHVRFPVDVEIQPVESHDDDDRDRHRNGQRPHHGRRCEAPDHESEQAIRDHGAHHVAAWKAVAMTAARDEVGQARAI